MKRLIAAIVMLLIICSLCILNIPKYTLTTTLSTNSSSNIKKTIELEELDKNKCNCTKNEKNVSKTLKTCKYSMLYFEQKEIWLDMIEKKYDLDNNGEVNTRDLLILQKYILTKGGDNNE